MLILVFTYHILNLEKFPQDIKDCSSIKLFNMDPKEKTNYNTKKVLIT